MTRCTLVAVAAAAALAVAGAAGATSAGAVVTGLGEQNTGFLTDPAFRELQIDVVRVVIPWDAALTGDARAQVWLDGALATGLTPLVAFERSRSAPPCPSPRCAGPSIAAYEAGVAAFRARWPQVTQITPWNEPNHRSQPTFELPGLAAQYYNAARRVCASCLLVAGDLLDDVQLATWLANYRQTLAEAPAVWGLHNYYDATYFASTGVDTLARDTSGEIWLTETGGIVRFDPGNGGGLPYDERRAADSLSWLYALSAQRPRVTRMYVYHWQGRADNDFDGGLIGPRGEARPGLAVVRANAGLRGAGAPAGAANPAPGGPPGQVAPTATAGVPGTAGTPGTATGAAAVPVKLRISGKGLRLLKRGLRVAVACVSAPRRCTGRLVVTPRRRPGETYRPRVRMNFDLRPGQTARRDIATSRRVRRALLRGRRLQVTYCLRDTRVCRSVQRRLIIRGRA